MKNNIFKHFTTLLIFVILSSSLVVYAQLDLITNIPSRNKMSLNGKWQYIVDPYETGFFDYRFQERPEKDPSAYWNTGIPKNKSELIEYGYNDKATLKVPGDWNYQDPKFMYYEGTVWYKKSFDYHKRLPTNRVFIYFGAVNYRADVYLNGRKLGMHKGGFTPFNFEVADSLLKEKDNLLVVKVDNKRFKDEVPTLNTDWWNYGGITGSVEVVEVPSAFIVDYAIHLKANLATKKEKVIEGWVKISRAVAGEKVVLQLPELKIEKTFAVVNGMCHFSFNATKLELWSPENPKLYRVVLKSKFDKTEDKVGFRTIETRGKQLLLNGKSIFMRGICTHAEIPMESRRAYSKEDAKTLLCWAKELNCNMVRLAHYPHDETVTRLADSLGLLIWSEIPVYWTIDFANNEVFEKANVQLQEMITRDRNRASVIIWSVGNETPVSAARNAFMSTLVKNARQLDATRLISAALEAKYTKKDGKWMIDIEDPLGEFTDIVSVNEYIGWYIDMPEDARNATWTLKYDKPLFFSETGAEAIRGFEGDELTKFSEAYQVSFYKEQIAMMRRMPDNYVGIAPWVLADFRSPKRNNPFYQEGWNNKGLIDQQGKKKKAFKILYDYYEEMKNLK